MAHDSEPTEMAKRLKAARFAKFPDTSASIVARRILDVDPSVLWRWEVNREPSAASLQKLADLYDVDVSWIIDGRGRGPAFVGDQSDAKPAA